MTPQLVERANRLYTDGYSLAVIGRQLGVNPTTNGTVLKKAPAQSEEYRSDFFSATALCLRLDVVDNRFRL